MNWLLTQIIGSFPTGLPLGNLTSQLLVNVYLKTFSSGVDFLGWVHFPHHRVLRTATKKRIVKNVGDKSLTSYTGMLRWGNGYKLTEELEKLLA